MNKSILLNLLDDKEKSYLKNLQLSSTNRTFEDLCIDTLMYNRDFTEEDLINKIKKMIVEYVNKLEGDKDFLYGICLGITEKIRSKFRLITMDCVDYLNLIINEDAFKADFFILLDSYLKGTELNNNIEEILNSSSNKVGFGIQVVSKLNLNKVGVLSELNTVLDDEEFLLNEKELLYRLEVRNSTNHINRSVLIDRLMKYESNINRPVPFVFKDTDIKELQKELKVIPKKYKKYLNEKELLIDIKELYISNILKGKVVVIEIKYDLNNRKDKRMTLFLGCDYLLSYNNKEVKILKSSIKDKSLFKYYFENVFSKDNNLTRSEYALSDIISIVSKRISSKKVFSNIKKLLRKEDVLRIERVIKYFELNSNNLMQLGLEYSISEVEGEKVLLLRNTLKDASDIFILHPAFIFNKSKLEYKYVRKSNNSIIKDYINHFKLASKDSELLGYDFTTNQLIFIGMSIEKTFRLNSKYK